MEKSTVIEFFGSAYQLAKKIKVARSTVWRWGRWVPRKYHDRIAAAIQDERRKRESVRDAMRAIANG